MFEVTWLFILYREEPGAWRVEVTWPDHTSRKAWMVGLEAGKCRMWFQWFPSCGNTFTSRILESHKVRFRRVATSYTSVLMWSSKRARGEFLMHCTPTVFRKSFRADLSRYGRVERRVQSWVLSQTSLCGAGWIRQMNVLSSFRLTESCLRGTYRHLHYSPCHIMRFFFLRVR